jgi:putative membrane-bound dehydrogenase-like protein
MTEITSMTLHPASVSSLLLLLFAPSLAAAEAPAAPAVASPVSPDQSLRHIVLADEDLSVELAACEPEVIDPVAIKFDDDGRMWVAEMHDYPLGALRPGSGKRTEKDAEPMSRIKILEDADGDGRFEKATLFADKLSFVTGIQPWKGGVIVTLAGKVAYMKDTDGDGTADVDETWFTGFAEQNAQLRANHPTFALDNWVYVANGLRGGKVVNHLAGIRSQKSGVREQESGAKSQIPNPKSEIRNPQSEIPLSGMDFRFNPLTGEAEAVSGNGQFGLTFDDWGNRFICSNRNPCMHVVIENRYLKRAPNVAIPAVVQDVAAAAENSRIYPLTRAWTTSNLHAGQFTAACGVFIYRGDLLPSLRGNVFTCDPTGNLVHREIMKEKGPTFESKPAYDGKEFLASRDEWFRPVSLQLGPDGALYIVDMYRAVIEHPEWVPDELKNRPDERLGDDRGRIYRIVPKAGLPKERRTAPKLSALKSRELVQVLGHENAWQRDTAQRLIVERQDLEHIETLMGQIEDGKQPATRTQAIWTLAGVRRFSNNLPPPGYDDPDPNVRLQSMRALMAGDEELGHPRPNVVGKVSRDPSAVVRFHAALLYGPTTNERLIESFADQVLANPDDPWMLTALLILSADPSQRAFLELLDRLEPMRDSKTGMDLSAAQAAILRRLMEQLGASGDDFARRGFTLRFAAKLLSGRKWDPYVDATAAFAFGLSKRGKSLLEFPPFDDPTSAGELRNQLRMTVEDAERSKPTRINSITLLSHLPETDSVIQELFEGLSDEELQLAALRALSRQASIEPWPKLVEQFVSRPPAFRSAILDGIFQRPERIALLLDAIEADTIRPGEIDRVQTDRLLKHGDAKIRERAAKIFGSATPADRQKALEDYQSVLTMKADATRGKPVFAKNCATCHKIGEVGVNVAPDISDSRTKTPAQILGDIIQPNRAIDANYIAWNVLLADGSSASGVLSAETGTSITLRQPEGKTLVVSRTDIEQLKSTGLSLMPEGLEKNIPHQDMADLIAFIKNWRYLDGLTPLNK